MITRGLDGTFYEIPDESADEYKVPPEEVQAKLGTGCGCLPNAPMGMSQEMTGAPPTGGSPQGVVINVFNPTAVQNPMTGPQQGPQQQQGSRQFLQGAGPEGVQGQGAGAQAGATCYSCYSCYNCYCYSCYCYSCYCYRTCYSCYVQPV